MYNNINLDNKKAKVTNTDSSSKNSSNSINHQLLFLRVKDYFLLELEKKYKNKLLNLKKLTKNNNSGLILLLEFVLEESVFVTLAFLLSKLILLYIFNELESNLLNKT